MWMRLFPSSQVRIESGRSREQHGRDEVLGGSACLACRGRVLGVPFLLVNSGSLPVSQSTSQSVNRSMCCSRRVQGRQLAVCGLRSADVVQETVREGLQMRVVETSKSRGD